MFRLNDGYFDQIACPEWTKTGKCDVINCIFRHEEPKKREAEPVETMLKKARVEAPHVEIVLKEKIYDKDLTIIVPKTVDHVPIPRSDRTVNTRKIANQLRERGSKFPNREAIDTEFDIANNCKTLEQYGRKIDELLHGEKEQQVDPKYILPKEVIPTPPATLSVRKQRIQLMVESLRKINPSLKTPILTAIEEEYKIASTSTSGTYGQLIKKKLYQMAHPEKFLDKKKPIGPQDYLRELNALVIDTDKLKRYGYIMDVPEAVTPVEDRLCKRCHVEFKLRDILEPVNCRYHPGKVLKKDKNVRVYECCGGIVGGETDPCEKSTNHVFYWNSAGEMHHSNPFKTTKSLFPLSKDSFKALGIDCEMGFTTEGFELLRITAVDFISGEEAFDCLVRPKGKVLDLNTRWSGISEIKDEALDFESLIQLLHGLMDYNTILIGHGLENDMNAMRLIHERIVDTAILYPKHKATPTFRVPLKYLTFKYLGRTIQTREHDSCEDAVAAIDVVKYFIEQDIKR